jgi:adenine/guanine phosphoribosyltransferase-like PRPP-binding protein
MERENMSPEIGLEIICQKEEFVLEYFQRIATVSDPVKKYIDAPFINQLGDMRFLSPVADIIDYHIRVSQIEADKVVQVPYSGNTLATLVAERIYQRKDSQENIFLVFGRKGRDGIPGSWHNTLLVENKIPSFTTGEYSNIIFNALEPEDYVYLVDDFIANGDTAVPIIKALQKKGVIVTGLGACCAKVSEPGLKRIYEETGIKAFYVIGVEDVTMDGEIILSPPQF